MLLFLIVRSDQEKQKKPLRSLRLSGSKSFFPVELLRRSTRRDSTGAHLTGVPIWEKPKHLCVLGAFACPVKFLSRLPAVIVEG